MDKPDGTPMTSAREAKLLGKARALRDRLNENIEALEAGTLDDESAKRIDDTWTTYHGVKDELHAVRMVWLSAFECARVFEVWNALGRSESGEALTEDEQGLLSRDNFALKFAHLMFAAFAANSKVEIRPKRAEPTVADRRMAARAWVQCWDPEYRDLFTDEQIDVGIAEMGRLGGRLVQGQQNKWDAIADLFRQAKVFSGKSSSLAQEWKDWPK